MAQDNSNTVGSVDQLSKEIRYDDSLHYGKVFYEDSGGGSAYVIGVIKPTDERIAGDKRDVLQVAAVKNAPKIFEVPAEDVGRIEYRGRPAELQ